MGSAFPRLELPMQVRRFHYAWVIVGVTLVTLMAAQAVRAAPGVIIVPLEQEFGWDRAAISLAVGVSLLAFGLGGPLGGWLLERFGPRRLLTGGILLIGAGLVALMNIRELWQLYVVWGIVIGLGTGAAGQVASAAIAQRWFRTHRGLIVGLFGGATSAGQLIFVPAMAALTVAVGWRAAIALLLGAAAVAVVPLVLLMRDRPSDVGQRAVGEGTTLTAAEKADDARRTPVREAVRRREFWLLAGSFFVCGYTSNGLIGTHLIPHAVEHGFTEVAAAGALALLGALNIVGTLASGWLTDRYDNRKLLAAYYGFRAMSLFALPLVYDLRGLLLFAVVYGLDWIATVPPTVNLTAQIFGRGSVGTLYGWIWFSHMVGAALAAYAGGFFRVLLGDYHLMFVSAGILGFIAVTLVSRIPESGREVPPRALEPVQASPA
jgi:MFS family permease